MQKLTINERIKAFRKEKKLSQKQFATSIGVTQSGVSYMEQIGSTVSDSAIKTICSVYNLNESWLRSGAEPMSIEPDTFSLEQYAKERGVSDLELAIAKTFFSLPKNVRSQMMAKLVDMMNEELKATIEPASAPPSASGPEPGKPPDSLEGLATEELEALYAEQQYKKTASGSA